MSNEPPRWVLEETTEDEPFPFLVETLDAEQQVRRFAGERFHTFDEAMRRAEFLNANGHNVRVTQELAFCTNKGGYTLGL